MSKLINVSNRLPVTVGEELRKSSGGLVAALDGLVSEEGAVKWIGWPGAEIADEGRRRELEDLLIAQFGFHPIYLDRDEIQGFYGGFSNSSLWPLLHYMPSRFRYEPAWWDHYLRVNHRFAEAVLDLADDGDVVWIHDYHLMLLPEILRRRAQSRIRIAFFLHTPFPSYEMFRCHPRRNELVSGLLGADLIGFHTFGYLRHFSSTVLRLLGIESEFTEIRQANRRTALGVYPIGINAARFESELASPLCAKHLESFRQAYSGKRVILSVERMDYTKGIPQRLDAIDLFLSRRENRDDVKFIFVSVPSREDVEQYRELRDEVEARVGRINGQYASIHNSPIHFIHGSVEFSELCALYALADVALVTPLIDGMNLVAKEFVACQKERAGVLILSEFAGAAQELFNATIVNPYDVQSVARAIEEALAASPAERRRRIAPMRDRVMKMDAQRWAHWLLHDLTSAPSLPVPDESGLANQAMLQIRTALKQGHKVAMFLDYDGTLREIEKDPGAARPNSETHAVLQMLRNRPGLDVTIVSGRTPADLEEFLGSYEFGLIAEHGATFRRPHQQQWEQLDLNANYAWMEEVLRVLRLFESSTPGSFIEQKRTSLVWHYRQTDPIFGSWKARALVAELAVLTANRPLKVRHGKKIVEITSTHLNKGEAILRVVGASRFDLILCAGDDATDEDMFQLELPNLLTVHIGGGETRAAFSLASPAAFRRFLEQSLAVES